ncbi:pentapeptide repeat-containing protein [Actinoplanes flavus]|uniref:pentapeptide repeat-containing protein n=1 Tax=Actinoplanes flavus TaxID=2820290 RepID=UPI003558406C
MGSAGVSGTVVGGTLLSSTLLSGTSLSGTSLSGTFLSGTLIGSAAAGAGDRLGVGEGQAGLEQGLLSGGHGYRGGVLSTGGTFLSGAFLSGTLLSGTLLGVALPGVTLPGVARLSGLSALSGLSSGPEHLEVLLGERAVLRLRGGRVLGSLGGLLRTGFTGGRGHIRGEGVTRRLECDGRSGGRLPGGLRLHRGQFLTVADHAARVDLKFRTLRDVELLTVDTHQIGGLRLGAGRSQLHTGHPADHQHSRDHHRADRLPPTVRVPSVRARPHNHSSSLDVDVIGWGAIRDPAAGRFNANFADPSRRTSPAPMSPQLSDHVCHAWKMFSTKHEPSSDRCSR